MAQARLLSWTTSCGVHGQLPADRPKVFAALTDPTMLTSGVVEHRQAALERVGWDPDRQGPGRHRPGSTWRRAWSRCWA